MSKKIFNIQWWHVVLIFALFFILLRGGFFNLQSFLAMSVINPETNTTYICTTTVDCYDQILVSFSGPLPAITCQDGICIETACLEGGINKTCITNMVCCSGICGSEGYCLDCEEDLVEKCWDGSETVKKSCVDGLYEETSASCPAYECTSDGECDYQSDENCDGKLDAVAGECILHKCTSKKAKRCTSKELFWGKYSKFLLIGGAIVLGGASFYIGKKSKK